MNTASHRSRKLWEYSKSLAPIALTVNEHPRSPNAAISQLPTKMIVMQRLQLLV
ncbi:MAG: hypothetical protein NW220_10630 [Leptolyngbyaceae cyanobacterium bins.349]|nr:hypothetical protein [Leptolyngbyaceae cyanobacterium bins.349]